MSENNIPNFENLPQRTEEVAQEKLQSMFNLLDELYPAIAESPTVRIRDLLKIQAGNTVYTVLVKNFDDATVFGLHVDRFAEQVYTSEEFEISDGFVYVTSQTVCSITKTTNVNGQEMYGSYKLSKLIQFVTVDELEHKQVSVESKKKLLKSPYIQVSNAVEHSGVIGELDILQLQADIQAVIEHLDPKNKVKNYYTQPISEISNIEDPDKKD